MCSAEVTKVIPRPGVSPFLQDIAALIPAVLPGVIRDSSVVGHEEEPDTETK